jgi:hypothetical protein
MTKVTHLTLDESGALSRKRIHCVKSRATPMRRSKR